MSFFKTLFHRQHLKSSLSGILTIEQLVFGTAKPAELYSVGGHIVMLVAFF